VVPTVAGYAETLRVGAGAPYLADNANAWRRLGCEPRSLEEGFRTLLPAMMAEMGID
jgi:hypothetical protein